MAARREQFVTTKEFLDSARSLGIKSLEGICELVDNAFDADASNIRIHIENNNDGTLQIIFVDDGLGIPAIHIDEEGNERQGIPFILAYGGRIPPQPTDPSGSSAGDSHKQRVVFHDVLKSTVEPKMIPTGVHVGTTLTN